MSKIPRRELRRNRDPRIFRDMNETGRHIVNHAEYDARRSLRQVRRTAGKHIGQLADLDVSNLYVIAAAATNLTDVLNRVFGDAPSEGIK